jgi:hypothetical protein
MLHIILVILKIAGIFLAAVLGLLLLAVLLLLFVPLHYELSAGHSEKETYGKGRLTWLLHLISLRFSYEKTGDSSISLQIFGFPVFPKPEKKKRLKPGQKDRERDSSKQETFQIKPKEPEQMKPEEEKGKEPAFEEVPLEEEIKTAEKETDFLKEPLLWESEQQEDEKRLGGFFRRIWTLFSSVFQRIKRLTEKIKQTFNHLSQTIRSFYSQFQFYLEIWQEEETRAFRRTLLSHISYLIRHFKPRNARGWFRYGLGDPALTGQLTGILYLFRPLDFSELEILPDFETETVFVEGDLSLKGHMRVFHAAKIAWKLFFDKNLKQIRQRIKNRRNKL